MDPRLSPISDGMQCAANKRWATSSKHVGSGVAINCTKGRLPAPYQAPGHPGFLGTGAQTPFPSFFFVPTFPKLADVIVEQFLSNLLSCLQRQNQYADVSPTLSGSCQTVDTRRLQTTLQCVQKLRPPTSDSYTLATPNILFLNHF